MKTQMVQNCEQKKKRKKSKAVAITCITARTPSLLNASAPSCSVTQQWIRTDLLFQSLLSSGLMVQSNFLHCLL